MISLQRSSRQLRAHPSMAVSCSGTSALTMGTVMLSRAVSKFCSLSLHVIISCYSECSVHSLTIKHMTVYLYLIPY
ncbi:hypothetical protein OIU77_008334 [Salix suchowensis]|uniref:Uncharacterized protein n=1 Tax=Salix suchowensis TaxID=1278906 RepID=A0ABQ9AKL8_9ROSI|nr:hypothetical protein OIU77_008334 [Salix suchowensis]